MTAKNTFKFYQDTQRKEKINFHLIFFNQFRSTGCRHHLNNKHKTYSANTVIVQFSFSGWEAIEKRKKILSKNDHLRGIKKNQILFGSLRRKK